VASVSSGGEGSTKRPWLAALLSFLIPGLGQLYLREWIRSFLWFFTTMMVVNLLLPPSLQQGSPGLSADAMWGYFSSFPPEAVLGIATMTLLATVDAYVLASRANSEPAVEEMESCPNCGKELDADLEFCHWCSTELPGRDDESAPGEDAEGVTPR